MSNTIREILHVEEASNRMISAFQNTRVGQGFMLQFNYPLKVNSWCNMQHNVSGFWAWGLLGEFAVMGSVIHQPIHPFARSGYNTRSTLIRFILLPAVSFLYII